MKVKKVNDIVIQDVNTYNKSKHKDLLITSRYNLFYLQKKIYQASKECHLSLVQSLQKLLVSLSSIKILAYIKVQKTITKSKVVGEDISVYNYSELSSDFSILIRKQIILWCLQPEWQPKIEASRVSKDLTKDECNLYNQNNLFDFKTEISFKNIKKQYILAKLQTIQWISEVIIDCFYNTSFVQSVNSSLNSIFKCDNLYLFIQSVLFNGISWNLFRQTMLKMKISIDTVIFLEYLKKRIYIYEIDRLKLSAKKILLYLISDLNFTAKSLRANNIWNLKYINSKAQIIISELPFLQNNFHKIYYNEFFYSLQNILFHKDKFGRLRTNTHLSMSMVSYQVNNLIKKHKSHFLKTKSNTSPKINKQIRNIVYKWAKKNYK